MKRTAVFDEGVAEYEQWYESYPEVYQSEILALQEHFLKLPDQLRGIEVELGTGRFSEPLGIKEGVEPSIGMSELALKKGIDVMNSRAEHLPYAALQFDFVLFVTVCHLDNVRRAISEAFRVLRPQGAIIIGFLDKNRPIAQAYWNRREQSDFYASATFYSVEEVQSMLRRAGFKNFTYNQTLFGALDEIKEIQTPVEGFGLGSFVTVKAIKP